MIKQAIAKVVTGDNLTEEEMKSLAELYHELSGDSVEETLTFLRFEEQEEIFCS